MDLWIWIVTGVALIGFIALIVWLLRWRDAGWNEADQNRAFSWSKRGGSGGWGS